MDERLIRRLERLSGLRLDAEERTGLAADLARIRDLADRLPAPDAAPEPRPGACPRRADEPVPCDDGPLRHAARDADGFVVVPPLAPGEEGP